MRISKGLGVVDDQQPRWLLGDMGDRVIRKIPVAREGGIDLHKNRLWGMALLCFKAAR